MIGEDIPISHLPMATAFSRNSFPTSAAFEDFPTPTGPLERAGSEFSIDPLQMTFQKQGSQLSRRRETLAILKVTCLAHFYGIASFFFLHDAWDGCFGQFFVLRLGLEANCLPVSDVKTCTGARFSAFAAFCILSTMS